MVTVTVCPLDNPRIVKENKPSGKLNPEGGGGEMLPTADTAKLEKPPAVVVKDAVPKPVAVATLSLVGSTEKFTQFGSPLSVALYDSAGNPAFRAVMYGVSSGTEIVSTRVPVHPEPE